MKQTPPRPAPWLVAVGGIVASGKTTIAERLASLLGADHLGADETRLDLFRAGSREAFVPGFSRRVYAELLARARAALEAGRSVVVDGSFRTRSLRARARSLAEERGARFLFVECRPGVEVCRARVRRRDREAGPAGRGWEELFEGFLALWEPVDELPRDEHLVLDTSLPPEALKPALVTAAQRASEPRRCA